MEGLKRDLNTRIIQQLGLTGYVINLKNLYYE